MLTYFVWVVKNLFQPAMMAALIFAIAKLFNNPYYSKNVLISTLAGVGASGIAAHVIEVNIIPRDSIDILNLYVMGILLIASVIFIAFNWGILVYKKPFLHQLFLCISSALFIFSLILYEVPNILLYPFQSPKTKHFFFDSDFQLKMAGYLLGVFVAVLICLTFYKIVSSLATITVRIFSTVFIVLNGFSFFGKFMAPLLAQNKISASPKLIIVVDNILQRQAYYTIAIIVVALVLTGFCIWRSFHTTETFGSSAEHRKIYAKCRNQRIWSYSFITLCIFSLVTLIVNLLLY